MLCCSHCVTRDPPRGPHLCAVEVPRTEYACRGGRLRQQSEGGLLGLSPTQEDLELQPRPRAVAPSQRASCP